MSRKLIVPALRQASRVDGAIRLVEPRAARSGAGLFPSSTGKFAAAIREAVPRLLSEDPRAANQPRQVRPTEAGLRLLLEKCPASGRARLVEEASPLYQKALYTIWAALIEPHGSPSDRSSWEECGARLAAPFLPPAKDGSTATATSDASGFQRALAQELVISWKHAASEEVREGLARAMRGAGLKQLGFPGEVIRFEGSYHRSEKPMFPGDEGKVLESGWLIHDGKGEYLLEKAILAPG